MLESYTLPTVIPGVKLHPGVLQDWNSDPGFCALTGTPAARITLNAPSTAWRTWVFISCLLSFARLRDDDRVARLDVDRLADAFDRIVVVELQRRCAGRGLAL